MEIRDTFFYRKEKNELNGGLVLRQAHKSHLVLTIAETILFSTKAFPELIKPSAARPFYLYSIAGHLLFSLMGPIHLSHVSYYLFFQSKSFTNIKGIFTFLTSRFRFMCSK